VGNADDYESPRSILPLMKRLPRLAPRDWIGLALVLTGFILRLRQYLANRSLWLDEAMLTNNILSRSFAGLFQPLSNDQGAPIGFLLLQKTITLTIGNSEYALRLFPFLAGCLSLVLMFVLVRKVSSSFAGSLAIALFAFSPALIYYSSEVKQYSSDVAITLGLCLLFLKYDHIELKHKDAALLALAGMLAIWFSHPALFVLGGLGLALFIPALRARDSRRIITLLIVALLWSLSFAALYFINLRQLASHQFFLDFWREGFLPHDPSALRWLAYSLQTPFFDLLGLRIPYSLSAILFLIGLIALTRRLPRFGLFLLLLLLLTLFASFLNLYPFAGRMILFLAPVLTILLAEAVDVIAALLSRPRWIAPMLFLVMSGFLLFGPVRSAVENFTAPKTQEHIRPAMEALRNGYRQGDIIYVYYWAEHAVRFYAPKYGFAMSDFIFGADHHEQPELYRAEMDALRGHARVWFLFSHVYENGDFNERDYILSREIRAPSTSVYLYLYDLQTPTSK
jgi:uncharacterized membrane protein